MVREILDTNSGKIGNSPILGKNYLAVAGILSIILVIFSRLLHLLGIIKNQCSF